MELLIFIRDKSAPSTEKAGDVIAIQPDGWAWSPRERTNRDWRIIRTGGLLETHAACLLSAPRTPIRHVEHFRGWAIDVRKLPYLPGGAITEVSADVVRAATFKRPLNLDWEPPVDLTPISTSAAFAGLLLAKHDHCFNESLKTGSTRRAFLMRCAAMAFMALYLTVKRASAATITSSIGTSSRTYSTVAAWVAALPSNAVTAGNSYVGECYNDSEFLVAGTVVTFTAITTDSTHTITLTAAAGQSFQDHASVRTNTLRYDQTLGVGLRNSTGDAACIAFTGLINYITIKRLQVASDGVGGTTANYAYYDNSAGSSNAVLKDCVLECSHPTTNTPVVNFSGTFAINLVVVQRGSSGRGITSSITNPTWINCTVARPTNRSATGIGATRNYGTPLMKNCCFFGFTTVVSGTWSSSSSNCATDQASGLPGTANQHSVTYSTTTPFENATGTTRDFRAIVATSLAGNGVLDATNAPADIGGYTRPASPTIGAWQLTFVPGTVRRRITVINGLLLLLALWFAASPAAAQANWTGTPSTTYSGPCGAMQFGAIGWLYTVHDPVSNLTFIYGGDNAGSIYSNCLYAYNPTTGLATSIFTTGSTGVDPCPADTSTAPGDRHPYGLYWIDTDRNRMWLMGGVCNGVKRVDMYYMALNASVGSNTFTSYTPGAYPSIGGGTNFDILTFASALHIPTLDVDWLFGYDGGAGTHDEWIHCVGAPNAGQIAAGCTSADTWQEVTSTGTKPATLGELSNPKPIWDSCNNKVLVFTNGTHRVFTYTPSTKVWAAGSTTGQPAVNASFGAGMNGQPVAFIPSTCKAYYHHPGAGSGSGASADYTYDAATDTWASLGALAGAVRTDTMTYDASRNVLVTYGSSGMTVGTLSAPPASAGGVLSGGKFTTGGKVVH